MGESIFRRAKAFIGLEEEGEGEAKYGGQQLDMSTVLKGKRESKGQV